MGLESIYAGSLLEHNNNPSCKHALEGATHAHEGINSSCGDSVTLQLALAPNGTIESAAFTGSGCAISQASADIMAGLVAGKTLEEAQQLANAFFSLLSGEEVDPSLREALGEAADLEAVSSMPARVKCAQLGWRTLQEMASDPGACAL